MFNWFINKVIESKVNSSRKNSKKEFVEWNDVKTICILTTKDEFFKQTSLVEFIKNSGKKVDAVLFLPGKETSPDKEYISFDKKQTTLLGLPKEEALKDVSSKSYDLLLDCNFKDYNFMKYLAGSLNAKFKVGFGGLLYHNYFDICIDLNGTPDLVNYLKEAGNYLKMIRTKN